MIIPSSFVTFLAAPILTVSASSIAVEPSEDARIAYSNCLIDGHNSAMRDGLGLKQFEQKSKELCMAERKIYYDIIYKSEKDFGSSNSEADEYATEESDNTLQSIVTSYANNLDGKVELVKTKN